MSKTYYVVEVEDSIAKAKPLNGEKLRFVITPNLQLQLETRSLDEILSSANDKGLNTSYCASFSGISSQRYEEVWRVVHSYVVGQFGPVGRHDICVEVVARATQY